jgi:hypothetical protein
VLTALPNGGCVGQHLVKDWSKIPSHGLTLLLWAFGADQLYIFVWELML